MHRSSLQLLFAHVVPAPHRRSGCLRRARCPRTRRYVSGLKGMYMLWPAANVINFAFVSPEYRVLYANVVNIAWWVLGPRMAP